MKSAPPQQSWLIRVSIVLGLALAAYVGVCAVVYSFQRTLLFSPPDVRPRAGDTRVRVPNRDIAVFASTIPHDGPDALLYLGGNSEEVSYSLPGLRAAFPHTAIYALHYRSFSGTEGEPSESSLFGDAIALHDLIRERHSRIVVIGSSLGTGIATYLAGNRPVARLILVTPYDSLANVFADKLRLLPVRLLMRDQFEAWRYARQVSAPTLLITAGDDEMIPHVRTTQLLAQFRPGIAREVVVPGVSHNAIYQSATYKALLADQAAGLK